MLQVLTLDASLEQRLLEAVRPGDQGAVLGLDASTVERVVDGAGRALLRAEGLGQAPVLVCAPAVRAPLRRLLAPHVPRLPVLSYAEIDPALTIETTGVVNDAAAIAA